MPEPPPATQIALSLDRAATPVHVAPGNEIVVKGSYTSTFDGSVIDASATTFAGGQPGSASVDQGGLIDFAGGGFHITSRDPITHEVHAVATGEGAPACAAVGVAGPCLPMRTMKLAQSRLMSSAEFSRTLKGGLQATMIAPPAYAPVTTAARSNAPAIGLFLALLLAVIGAVLFSRARRQRAASPRGQLLALASAVREKARRANPIIAAPLTPAIDAALSSLEGGKIDPSSPQGQRVRVVLERVATRLDEAQSKLKEQSEKAEADDLVRELDVALEAAEETLQLKH